MSDDNVMPLAPGISIPGRADPQIVGMLEEALADAKAGRVHSFAAVALRSDGTTARCWKWAAGYDDTLLGAVSRLLAKLVKEAEDAA